MFVINLTGGDDVSPQKREKRVRVPALVNPDF
jgi:hypothetical protein